MPFTFNGMGTHYYGKKDLDRHPGTCEHCGASGQLETYETRLWIVVLFIPVIPLGRQQILDYCSSCTRHRVVPIKKWERLKAEAIKDGSAQVAQNPDDPQAAVNMHSSLVFFRKKEEAARLGALMAERFADNAAVQLYLGGWHDSAGRGAEADRSFESALAVEPANASARRAVAIGCIRRGELERARELLSFMEQPGQPCEPAVLGLLAGAHQARGQHEAALDVYAAVLRQCPAIGRDKAFRRNVAKSEKALGRRPGMLPPKPPNRLLRFGLGAAAVVLLGAFLLFNHYRASHQELHVVNALKLKATVSIPGRAPLIVLPHSYCTVEIPEGRHRATVKVEGLPVDSVDFEVHNGLLERLAGQSTFVLNVKGAVPVYREEVLYVPVGSPGSGGPRQRTIHLGRSFSDFRGVDYAFERRPMTISTDSSSGTMRKICVGALLRSPLEAIDELSGEVPAGELLSFAELHLGLDPDDQELSRAYLVMTAGTANVGRCRDFLEKGLERRPVSIEWHRTYHTACKLAGRWETLPALYDRMLAKEPGSSALLYLRGRLCSRASEARGFYDRALAADPANPYPRFALAYRLVSRGDFAAARPLCAEACRLKPADADMANLFADVRFALGEGAALRTDLEARLKRTPLDANLYRRLLKVHVAAGDTKAVAAAQTAYAVAALNACGRNQKDAAPLVLWSRLELLALQGSPDLVLKESAAFPEPAYRRQAALRANLDLGRPAEAEKHLPEVPAQDPYLELLMSSAWRRAGDVAKATACRERAIKAFATGDAEDRSVADLLAKVDSVDLDAVDDLALDAGLKAVVLVALAEGAPATRAGLLERARKLNFDLDFPHRFLEAVVAELSGQK